jgi:MYXO-CTERM domain-containing protein
MSGPARAAGQLPHGITLGQDGRYYQDVCDHSVRFHCLSKRLLPETFRPLAGGTGGGGDANLCTCTTANPCGGGTATAPKDSMAPANILAAYKIPSSSSAAGKIVAVIDMPDANAQNDVNVYRKQFGIPALPACPGNGLPEPGGGTPCFAAVDEGGNVTSAAGDCQPADAETALDMEMISAGCPDCSILLVQMTTGFANPAGPQESDFVSATKSAIALGAVAVSISFGAPEQPGLDPNGQDYTTPGHLVFGAAGDYGYLDQGYAQGINAPSYPASAADVLSVGGTNLKLDGSAYSEVVWNDGAPPNGGGAGGSGCSTEFAMPDYQKQFLSANAGAFGSCTMRASVDVSAAAQFSTTRGEFAIAEYDSVDGWLPVVGTSAASPMMAGLFTRLGLTDAVSSDIGWVYRNISAFNDVTSGNDDVEGTCTSVLCEAGNGWDGPTGVGTPNGENLAVLDAGVVIEPTSPAKAKSGCGCSTAAAGGLGPLWLTLGAAFGVFALRRRRG